MSQLLGISDYVVIALVLGVSASIGLYFRFTGGRQKTLEEFLLAGRNMAIPPVAFSLLATYISAISLLGIPAETYLYGVRYSVCILGLLVGYLFCAYGCMPTYYDLNVSTTYEYLEIRFGKTIRNIVALLFVVRMVFYIAIALYTPSLALNAVTGLSIWTSILSLTGVCIFYCYLGGLKAVVWTDVFQAILMCVPLIAIAVQGVLNLGLQELYEINKKGERMVLFIMSSSLTERYTFWNSLVNGMTNVFESSVTLQSQVQRLLSVGNLKKAQWSLFWGMTLIGVFKIFAVFSGMVIYGMFHDCDPVLNPNVHLGSSDQIVPYTVLKMFGGLLFLPGLFVSGIFSGALSSVSSALNGMAGVVVEDFLKPYCQCTKFTDKWMTIVAKLLAILFGGLSLLLIIIVANFRGIFEASYILNGLGAGSLIGIYLLALFTTTANEPGTIIGFFVSFAFNAWIAVGAYKSKPKKKTLPRGTAGCTATLNEKGYEEHFYLQFNNMSLLSTEGQNTTSLLNTEDRYIFPLYRISPVWLVTSGTLISLIVGYVASYIIGLKSARKVDPKCISPFVRRLYFSAQDIEDSNKKTQIDIEMTEDKSNVEEKSKKTPATVQSPTVIFSIDNS
ncbi:putative sodium-dependent multivitamin transporter [Argiope bruennichi]|uniref:putative sodium-dependent multivitamin transporter n=1 Tax=Argiope bruennichi TaxID=94029 RepID=UPI00249566EB|nr:putative sodium-dependent multivitamin transporter [Argiope bruennichi]